MKTLRATVITFLLSLSMMPLTAGAGFPTFDLTGYLQEILGYTQDGQQIANEIKNWENELKRWQQLYKAFEDGDLENILGGINGAIGRLDNTLGRYNVSVEWLDNVSDLSTTITDTGFDFADIITSGDFSSRDIRNVYDDITDISTDILSLSADIKAANLDNKKQRAAEGEDQVESAENKEDQAGNVLTGGSSAQTEGTVASEAIEQTTNAVSDTFDERTDQNIAEIQNELETMMAQVVVLQETLDRMMAEEEFGDAALEEAESLADSVDVADSIQERDPTRIRGM